MCLYFWPGLGKWLSFVICVLLLQNLEENIELTKVKIERAEKLISGLGGEKDRWTNVSTPLFAVKNLFFLIRFITD